MAPTEVMRSHRIDSVNINVEAQPHLRWQILVIFTIFVTIIRFSVWDYKSEILIYSVCTLILLMAAALILLCSLRKDLNTSPNRLNNNNHQRNGSGNGSIGSRRRSRGTNTDQQQYQLETIINPGDDGQFINETVIMSGYTANDFISYGISMPHTNNNLEYINSDSLEQLQHQNNLLASGAPPPYQIAILLPEPSTSNKDFDENTPPPSYDKIIDISLE